MSSQRSLPTVKGVRPGVTRRAINGFSIMLATVNGTGSQTANMALMGALFRMGIPVGATNLFPSNIQGLPTWFTIRVSSKGYVARSATVEILVAMNQATFAEDLAGVVPGGVCFHDEDLQLPSKRADVTCYPMPIKPILQQVAPPAELRDYIANMIYVGVVSQLLGVELAEVRNALHAHFRGKKSAIELNMTAVEGGAAWAAQNLAKQDRFRVQRDQKTQGQLLIDGNTAAGLGAIYGGLTFAAWYPITPASSLADAVNEYLPVLRRDKETGKATYAVIQAEDELAAMGMAVGAGWAGARAMTCTSGPGISLMAEFAGLAFFTETPVVVWDVQRIGPATGLPTRTSQGDILFVRFLGHGDTKHVMLLPGNVAECFEYGWRAFDLAERLQTPVFVLSDLDLGMNPWMSPPFEYPDQPMDRGKVLSKEELDRVGEFARYRDVDGDGIPYRTLPGNDHPLAAWLARGTGHNEQAQYSERASDWSANLERLWRKLENARKHVPGPQILRARGKPAVGLIGFGSTDPAIREARDLLADQGLKSDYMRLRAVPFTPEVGAFIRAHERLYVIEANLDGQMRQLLQLEVPDQAAKLRSASHCDGLPLTAQWIQAAVLEQEEG